MMATLTLSELNSSNSFIWLTGNTISLAHHEQLKNITSTMGSLSCNRG